MKTISGGNASASSSGPWAICLAASTPFSPGMRMSRNTTSGRCWATSCTASRPLRASATICSSGQASASRARNCSRIRRSSSASTARTAAPGAVLMACSAGVGLRRRSSSHTSSNGSHTGDSTSNATRPTASSTPAMPSAPPSAPSASASAGSRVPPRPAAARRAARRRHPWPRAIRARSGHSGNASGWPLTRMSMPPCAAPNTATAASAPARWQPAPGRGRPTRWCARRVFMRRAPPGCDRAR